MDFMDMSNFQITRFCDINDSSREIEIVRQLSTHQTTAAIAWIYCLSIAVVAVGFSGLSEHT